MIWIEQTDANGCGPACLAMIAGITYATAKEILERSPSMLHKGDWDKEGVSHITLDAAFQTFGFWRQRVYRIWQPTDWPPKPWAPVHLCQVAQPSGNHHFVVMDRDGHVLDPLRQPDVSHRLADYPDVFNVCGLYRPEVGA